MVVNQVCQRRARRRPHQRGPEPPRCWQDLLATGATGIDARLRGVPEESLKGERTGCKQGYRQWARRRPHPERAGVAPAVGSLVCNRRIGAEATTGLAATMRRKAGGKTAEHGCRHQPPREAPWLWEVVEEAVEEVRKQAARLGCERRGERFVPFSSGAGLRAPQREKV